MEHRRAIVDVMIMLWDTPLVFDRELSYKNYFEDLKTKKLEFIIQAV